MALEVVEDFNHCNAFLRASRNRVHNTLETAHVLKDQAEQCLALADTLYNAHVQFGDQLLAGLQRAVQARCATSIEAYMKALHKYNRQTAKLSRLFESDMSDYQPEPPEYEYEEDKPPPRLADPDRRVTISKFMRKLNECHQATLQASADAPTS